MIFDPSCDAQKFYGYSWPLSPHWWISLNSADQGAWAAGLGAFAAALAAVGVVYFQNRLARKERRARSRLTAAYLYMPIAQLDTALKVFEAHARLMGGVLAGSESKKVWGSAKVLDVTREQFRWTLDTFNISDVSYLPGDIGENLATGIMESRFVFDRVESAATTYLSADDLEDAGRADARRFTAGSGCESLPFLVTHARGKILKFLDFCTSEFGTNPQEEKDALGENHADDESGG